MSAAATLALKASPLWREAPHRARATAAVIADFQQDGDNSAIVSARDGAIALNRHVSNWWRGLRAAVDAGLVEIVQHGGGRLPDGRGRAGVYRLTCPYVNMRRPKDNRPPTRRSNYRTPAPPTEVLPIWVFKTRGRGTRGDRDTRDFSTGKPVKDWGTPLRCPDCSDSGWLLIAERTATRCHCHQERPR